LRILIRIRIGVRCVFSIIRNVRPFTQLNGLLLFFGIRVNDPKLKYLFQVVVQVRQTLELRIPERGKCIISESRRKIGT
jgi:hypothetical protein